MALPVNVEDLINKSKVESSRIEFKAGWNPRAIYHSICAMANDFDNLGGGYIIVGVEEEKGIAKRPVKGISLEEIDGICRDMIGYDKKMRPYYSPRTSVEEVDGRSVLVIWVASGLQRPYQVPRDVAAKDSPLEFYIRKATSSVIASESEQRELWGISDSTPFADRGNPDIRIHDISLALLRDHLVKVNSRLVDRIYDTPIEQILEQMNLLYGPVENRMVKNVAAMMFCETPEKFFPYTQVEIVHFPEGRESNPDNLQEVPAIKGSVPQIIKNTLEYLRNHVIMERIVKLPNQAESVRVFNYPYQALEEAVVNALYHRDYTQHEPVEITIEPGRVSILSYSGPDRSISMKAIREGKSLRSRRYKNRVLGDFLKELKLAESRATGIPTIQQELARNGSPCAYFETDEDRSYFLIDIPCHRDFNCMPENVSHQLLTRELAARVNQYLGRNTAGPASAANAEALARMLLVCSSERSPRELMDIFQQKNRYRLHKECLSPLLESGLLVRTLPASPRSKYQKYKLTEEGRALIEEVADSQRHGKSVDEQ